MLADLSRVYGQNQAGVQQGMTGLKVNSGTQLAQPYANTYKQEGDAAMNGSANLWKFGMAGAQALAGMPGGFGLGGSTASPGQGGGLFGGTIYNGNPTMAGFGPIYG